MQCFLVVVLLLSELICVQCRFKYPSGSSRVFHVTGGEEAVRNFRELIRTDATNLNLDVWAGKGTQSHPLTVRVPSGDDEDVFRRIAGRYSLNVDLVHNDLEALSKQIEKPTNSQIKERLMRYGGGSGGLFRRFSKRSGRPLSPFFLPPPKAGKQSTGFISYSEIIDKIMAIRDKVRRNTKNKHRLRITVISIGKTFQGRDIPAVIIEKPTMEQLRADPTLNGMRFAGLRAGQRKKRLSCPTRPIIYFDAGIHAREWLAPAVALYLIERIVRTLSMDATVDDYKVVKKFRFVIVPTLNPDGYESTRTTHRFWRKNMRPVFGNCTAQQKQRPSSSFVKAITKAKVVYPKDRCCIGVDLNRNFPFYFELNDMRTKPCSEEFPGLTPLTEPETIAEATFMQRLRTFADESAALMKQLPAPTSLNLRQRSDMPQLSNYPQTRVRNQLPMQYRHIKQQSSAKKYNLLFLYISLHSYGGFWIVPHSVPNVTADNDAELRRVANAGIHEINRNLPQHKQWSTGTAKQLLDYYAAGCTFDWAKDAMKFRLAYTIELPPTDAMVQESLARHGLGFVFPWEEVPTVGQTVWRGLMAALKEGLKLPDAIPPQCDRRS